MVFRRSTLAVLFWLVNLAAGYAGNSEEARPGLVTDRPDLTESSSAVPRGTIQVETGWSMERFTPDGETLTAQHFPASLVRIGIHDRVELRLGWDGGQWQELRTSDGTIKSSGAGDMQLGTKIAFLEEGGLLPEAAVIIGTSVPGGSECRAAEQLEDRFYCSSFNLYSSRRWDPSAILAMSKTLNDTLSIGWNIGTAWLTEREDNGDLDTLPRGLYSIALGITATERAAFFVEFFGDTSLSGVSGPSNSVDGGMTFLALPNLQLDVSAGKGLSREAPDWFAGVGVSFRLPG